MRMKAVHKCGVLATVLLLLPGFPVRPAIAEAKGVGCDAESSERLGTSFALAVFYPDRFASYVDKEKGNFGTASFRKCLGGLVKALEHEGLNTPSGQDIESRAMSVASRAGAPELGPKVAEDWKATQGNPSVLALLMRQLSNVLTGEKAYEDTLLYQDARQRQSLGELLEVVGGEAEMGSFWEHYIAISYDLTRWYVESLARASR